MALPALAAWAGANSGSLISAGGALLGGVLGSRTDSTAKQSMRQLKYSTQTQNYWNRQNLKFSKAEQRRAKREFRINTRQAIQRRVADAKKAGLHPLYALGANAGAGTSSVNFMPGQAPTGSGVQAYQTSAALGRGISQAASQLGEAFMPQTAIETAQVNALNASAARDEAQAALAHSQAARAFQTVNSSQDGPLMAEEKLPNMYIKVHNNQTGKDVWLPNPDLGLEMPETLGAMYWLQSKQKDQRKGYPVPGTRKARRKAYRRRQYLRR